MKLLQVTVRSARTKDGLKNYTKYIVTIPNEIIDSLKWKKGDTLEIKKLTSSVSIKKV